MNAPVVAPIEYGLATFMQPGNARSGDLEVVEIDEASALLAVIDGVGHGPEAYAAAQIARQVLLAHRRQPVAALVHLCHEKLRATRGVVMSVVEIDFRAGLMQWLGVGNVQTVLYRGGAATGVPREELLLRSGVVGAQLPLLQSATIRIGKEDTLILATDGIRSNFADHVTPMAPPQLLAQQILAKFGQGVDDALVLVARLHPRAPSRETQSVST